MIASYIQDIYLHVMTIKLYVLLTWICISNLL